MTSPNTPSKTMLIDGTHAEELRVVLTENDLLQDFESETQDKTQLKGNIYIAEVSRVEPSLQAAFITYGGNRNGFLAFNELHPSFFAIEKEEKDTLIQELIALAERRNKMRHNTQDDTANNTHQDTAPEEPDVDVEEMNAEDARALAMANSLEPEETTDATRPMGKFRRITRALFGEDEQDEEQPGNKLSEAEEEEARAVETENQTEETKDAGFQIPKVPIHRRYKIDDVLKAGQKILVQVVKEERGNKGAALTTYFTLPGRYTVMMPNNPMAGGISRKISDGKERAALRAVYDKLDMPELMGLIVRTAGGGQAENNIQTDFKNLKKRWEDILKEFEKAQKSSKTDITCVHEDGSLIIRALRDMAKDDVAEIHIAGKRYYKQAKDYAKALMPDMAKRIKEHKKDTPIFTYYAIERQLNDLHHTRVHLPSGGYLIIQPTEALVSVDVNSGRATQGKNIEDTALKTNMEAAEELARQIRLRDLAGLIVIDFIDMEHMRHARQVERTMRKLCRQDRARVQLSQLSDFGLMQISRQRMRPSFVESHYTACPHCNGTGTVHTQAAAALMVLRRLEEEDVQGADRVIVHAHPDLVVYILNHKRSLIEHMEATYKYQLLFKPDEALVAPDCKLELVRMKADGAENTQTVNVVLREQPELPPEVRYSKEGRKQAREEAKTKAREAKQASARRAEQKKEGAADKPAHTEEKPKRRGRKPKAERTTKPTDATVDGKEAPKTDTAEKTTPEKTEKPKSTRRTPRRATKTDETAGTEENSAKPDTKTTEGKTEDKPAKPARQKRAASSTRPPKKAEDKAPVEPKKEAEKSKNLPAPIEDKPLAVVKVDANNGAKKVENPASSLDAPQSFQRWWSKS